MPNGCRHGWIAVWACVAAGVLAYVLVGWSERQGPFQVADSPIFPTAEYRVRWPEERNTVRPDLIEFLIRAGRVDLVAKLGSPEPEREVTQALEQMAENKNAEAARFLGLLALFSGGDSARAVPWFFQSATLEDAEACFFLAELVCIEKMPGADLDEVLELLLRSAALGSAPARTLAASLMAETGTSDEAEALMGDAVRHGDEQAMYLAGLFHANPEGREADPEAAAQMFLMAAERGEVRAMHALGLCFETGFGLKTSFSEASRWNKNAAALENVPAQRWCEARGIEFKP